MDVAEYIENLNAEGERMADAAERAGADAAVPTCPDWLVRDLVQHQGGVHRWATAYVAGAKTEAADVDFETAVGPLPDDKALVEWFRQGHRALVSALREADPDMACWTFLPAPSPLAMWARRQAHETAIHRVDAELAAGLMPVAVSPSFAADGIDELLTLFVPRRKGDPRADPARSLAVRCEDTRATWRVTISTEGVTTETEGGGAPADCVVSGPASWLYHALWNRLSTDEIAVEGDSAALDLFLNRSKIRWSI
jgi:uncharacterized protein (TIGR03083 family)